jgi:hypothetical protein
MEEDNEEIALMCPLIMLLLLLSPSGIWKRKKRKRIKR